MRGKTPQKVAGYRISCPDYDKCPLCYGCRNYDSGSYKCVTNCSNRYDRCDTQKHIRRLIGKLLTRSTVTI